MHVFIGGAYNGKTDYVMRLLDGQSVTLIDGVLPSEAVAGETLVVKNLERWLITQNLTEDAPLIDHIVTTFEAIEKQCTLYVIVTDMGRGVVPMDKQARYLRDTCGRLYQALFARATHVERIWYGIGERLK
ncbi:bifunctional adenosylcobinamide kinase/adenosylcobinamide-phosphate guanylyltransferase [Lysinibacillus piscis]|uniref:Adenosylcobinamide kinase n=1 Tax=Lysinibacillus piscis TaxID=2518931 RepID=A0ABQ5NKH5_9BACI|nr:bifunctional adenosylcobinamide kinase/adenosylcobinamide-phosphate guanylyltransferase [Lysinibacillus sp. KH24]GLC88870.1 hypothetical protein LYSBPC_19970 [Lysinibacillus sp. KH24]